MNKKEKTILKLFLIFLLIMIGLIILIISKTDSRPDVNEFCVRNEYIVGAKMTNIDSGVCLKPNQYGYKYPSEQYFGWNGSNWRFIDDI